MELILMQVGAATALLIGHLVAVVRDRTEHTNRDSGTVRRIVESHSRPSRRSASEATRQIFHGGQSLVMSSPTTKP